MIKDSSAIEGNVGLLLLAIFKALFIYLTSTKPLGWLEGWEVPRGAGSRGRSACSPISVLENAPSPVVGLFVQFCWRLWEPLGNLSVFILQRDLPSTASLPS